MKFRIIVTVAFLLFALSVNSFATAGSFDCVEFWGVSDWYLTTTVPQTTLPYSIRRNTNPKFSYSSGGSVNDVMWAIPWTLTDSFGLWWNGSVCADLSIANNLPSAIGNVWSFDLKTNRSFSFQAGYIYSFQVFKDFITSSATSSSTPYNLWQISNVSLLSGNSVVRSLSPTKPSSRTTGLWSEFNSDYWSRYHLFTLDLRNSDTVTFDSIRFTISVGTSAQQSPVYLNAHLYLSDVYRYQSLSDLTQWTDFEAGYMPPTPSADPFSIAQRGDTVGSRFNNVASASADIISGLNSTSMQAILNGMYDASFNLPIVSTLVILSLCLLFLKAVSK